MNHPTTVIGLGMMGTKLAQLLLAAGHRVTVWNRSDAAAERLATAGALAAADAAQAVRAGAVIVLCVKDYAAANEILHAPGVAQALNGRTVVHLSTGSPREASAMEAWLHAQGGHLVAGAIQAAPEQMGASDTPILLAGAQAGRAAAEPVLRILGGGLVWLGERAALAPAMDFATLSYVYGTMAGFLHGVRIAEVEGLGVQRYAELVEKIAPSFGAFLRHEGEAIAREDYRISQSPLRISVDATARISAHAREAGLQTAIPDLSTRLFEDAARAGFAHEEAAAVVKLLRRPA
jgi:3-hydroxyisobutyrate dehydrogenase-like beta-hydroxyacid dehydrogenase